MIATITINPVIDKSSTVEKLVPEKKLRCSSITVEAGGGGINVSKAIKELGGKSIALFPFGGLNGKLLKKLLKIQNIPCKTVAVTEETRENFTITETSTNSQYRFVMPGSTLPGVKIEAYLALIESLDPPPSIIVASGSLPPGSPHDFFARIAAISKKMGAKCIVDTAGPPLNLTAKEGVYMLKPNLSELCSLAGKDYLQLNEVYEAAHEVILKGYCKVLVVSMGPLGAMLVTNNHHETVSAPTVRKLSTVGAGDSMVGGMIWMLEQGKPLQDVVRFGVACGTAATMNPGTQLFNKTDAFRLYEWINEHSMKKK